MRLVHSGLQRRRAAGRTIYPTLSGLSQQDIIASAKARHSYSQRGSSLLALELFYGHCLQGGNPTHPMLAQRYDLLGDKDEAVRFAILGRARAHFRSIS